MNSELAWNIAVGLVAAQSLCIIGLGLALMRLRAELRALWAELVSEAETASGFVSDWLTLRYYAASADLTAAEREALMIQYVYNRLRDFGHAETPARAVGEQWKP